MPEALELIGRVDKDDAPFVACALALHAPIWSADTHFTRQDKIRVLKTADLLK